MEKVFVCKARNVGNSMGFIIKKEDLVLKENHEYIIVVKEVREVRS